MPIANAADRALAERAEEAAMNAWPATSQLLHDGWVLRMANGFTRRANSVNVLRAGTRPLTEKIAFCERIYRQAGLPCVFRVTSLAQESTLDACLDANGYRRVDETLIMTAPASRCADAPEPVALGVDDWLSIYSRLAESPDYVARLHRFVLDGIRLPRLFAVQRDATGAGAVVGLAVLEADVVGLFDIVTDPLRRRQGHARGLVASLIGWGARQGARQAYLQVVGDNAAAISLYEALGFEHLYSYWYRVQR